LAKQQQQEQRAFLQGLRDGAALGSWALDVDRGYDDDGFVVEAEPHRFPYGRHRPLQIVEDAEPLVFAEVRQRPTRASLVGSL